MAIANIELKIGNKSDSKSIILESGTLKYIDSMIKSFGNEESLKSAEEFATKISFLSPFELQKSKIVLYYIKNNDDKIKLKPIYNDDEPILIRSNSIEGETVEIEKARKFLFSSRNQLFLSMFLNHNMLLKTTHGSIKMTPIEYKFAKNAGLSTFIRDGEYRVLIRDVLKYRLINNKLGVMRTLYEDTLEEWKKYMQGLSQEDLYFYSRELRILINDYNYRKIPRKAVCNLNLNRNYFHRLNNYHLNKELDITDSNTLGLYKKKVLEDKKSA